MKHTNFLSVLIISILLSSCATKMKIKGSAINNLQPLEKTASVVIIEENEQLQPKESDIKIGFFEIKDGGMSVDCSYNRVKDLAKQKARTLGGNTVKIISHKLPDPWSTCHRITFEIYKLEDISEFQKELLWSSTNKLKWEHFKSAPKVDLPSFFCGTINVNFNDIGFFNNHGEVQVQPIFSFDCSFVQPHLKSDHLLAYNQVKFDLLEYYARKMRNEFEKSQIDTSDKWAKFAKTIYEKIYNEYETDIYNLEIETNFGLDQIGLISWKLKTENDLKTLPEFSSEVY